MVTFSVAYESPFCGFTAGILRRALMRAGEIR
jgi:hypothetical protein